MGRNESYVNLVDSSDSGWVGAGDEDDLDERLMAEEEPIDEREPHVMTALGPIEPAALGLTLVGAWDVSLVGPDRDPATALLQLEQLYATGVRAVVELDCLDSESRLADLAWLSARSPIHILTSAGFTPDEFVAGSRPSVPVRPGLRVPPAVPNAPTKDGRGRLPIFVELTTVLDTLPEMARFAAETGVPLTAVADPLSATTGDTRAVLEAGARLVLIAGDEASTMPAVAARFKWLSDLGFSDRLGLGYRGDPVMVMERMPIFLMEAGLASIAVREILVGNPLQSLLRRGMSEDTAG